MVDAQQATLGLTLGLLGFATLAARGVTSVPPREPELGGAPPIIELEVRDRDGNRIVRVQRGILIGRSPSAGIRLADPTVSRVHARIERHDQSVRVEDLGSRNGTLLNGKPIPHEAVLAPGDRVRIGSTDIVFVGVGEWK